MEIQLDRILSEHTEQITRGEIGFQSHCLGFFFGEFSASLENYITSELLQKARNSEVIHFERILDGTDLEEKMDNAVKEFRKAANRGLEVRPFYIPIIFMADQLQSRTLWDIVERIMEKMDRVGKTFCIKFYCILNYEVMREKEIYVAQLQELKEKCEERNAFPYTMCILTPDMDYDGEFYQYRKIFQSIAMHIFLNMSDEIHRNNNEGIFTVGYWKMDILKQKLADGLRYSMNLQKKEPENEVGYQSGIRGVIENRAKLDSDFWLKMMMYMPVDDTGFRRLQKGNNVAAGEEIMYAMYGEKEILWRLLEENHQFQWNLEDCMNFFEEEAVGNLFCVKNRLLDTLRDLYSHYAGLCEEQSGVRRGYNETIALKQGWIRNSKSLMEVKLELKEKYWKNEIIEYAYKKKMEYISCLIEYMKTKDFREKIKEIEDKAEKAEQQLQTISRESAVLMDNRRTDLDDFELSEIAVSLKWHEPILDEDVLRRYLGNTSELQEIIKEWAHNHLLEMIGIFSHGLQKIENLQRMNNFYAARYVRWEDGTEKQGTIFINENYFNRNMIGTTEVDTCILQAGLIDVFGKTVSWESDLCLELFCQKQINDVTTIFGLH